jgi:ferredoxin-type protein NapH
MAIHDQKKVSHRKTLRYVRWSVRIAFLLFFTLPIKYFADAAIDLPIYSLVYGGLRQPLVMVPYGESICSLLLLRWTYVGPGTWIVCPLGGLEVLMTAGNRPASGLDFDWLLLSISVAILLFVLLIFLLGAAFCSWVCPVGTAVDGFDKGVERFMPKLNKRREERAKQNQEKRSSICPTCFLGKFRSNKHATVASGVLVTALVGSAIFRFPIWCTVCPVGITARGMFHLKAWTRITGAMMPIMIEFWIIPVVAVLAGLWEKRFWCRKLCPIGALVRLISSFNPFFKPTKSLDKCKCPPTSRRCQKSCPQLIGPSEKGAAECTKCLECYIECKSGAVGVKRFETPEAIFWLKAKLKRQVKPQEAGLEQQ